MAVWMAVSESELAHAPLPIMRRTVLANSAPGFAFASRSGRRESSTRCQPAIRVLGRSQGMPVMPDRTDGGHACVFGTLTTEF